MPRTAFPKTLLFLCLGAIDASQADPDFKLVGYGAVHAEGRGGTTGGAGGQVVVAKTLAEEISDYGIAVRAGAHAKLENNLYHNVKLPMSTDKFPVEGLPNGYLCESGNVLSGTTGAKVISQTGCDRWTASTLPYAYAPDPVSKAEDEVRRHAGLGANAVAIRGAASETKRPSSRAPAFDLRGRRLHARAPQDRPTHTGVMPAPFRATYPKQMLGMPMGSR